MIPVTLPKSVWVTWPLTYLPGNFDPVLRSERRVEITVLLDGLNAGVVATD
jgi:hypothetical protein